MANEILSNGIGVAAKSSAQTWAEGRANLARKAGEGVSDPNLYTNVAKVEDQVDMLARMSSQDSNTVKRQGLQEAARARGSRVTKQELAELL